MNIILLPQVKKALSILIKAGYEAYIVGGCVRDALMQITPHDYDITTNALPQQIKQLFAEYRLIDTGVKHGTVTVVIDNMSIEITTFRIDGEYNDYRYPKKVKFTNNLKEDLHRRDFTMNALAYNYEHGLIDYFNGVRDIERKLIRCVGDPDKRFNEDALRILRALRFSSLLGFNIEPYTAQSIYKNKNLLNNITKERLSNEFSLLIFGDNLEHVMHKFIHVFSVFIPEILPMQGFKQNNIYHIYDVLTHTLKVVNNVPKILHIRLAALFHDIAKPATYSVDQKEIGHFYGHQEKGAEMAKSILQRLKFDNFTISRVTQLILYHDINIEYDEKSVKRWLNKITEQGLRDLITLKKADILAKKPTYYPSIDELNKISCLIDEIIEKHQCFSLKNLTINGNDLISLGASQGKLIGKILDKLLFKVIDGILPNEKEILMEEARCIIAQEKNCLNTIPYEK